MKYVLLGIFQGVFEWLPISSEGIVALFSEIFELKINSIDIALFLHLGTLLAVLVYFRKEWKEIILLKNKKLLYFLFITTTLSLAIGFPLYHIITGVSLGASLLFIMGIGLFTTSFFNKKKSKPHLKFQQTALLTGILQGLAVIPGLSRSGSTIFGLSFSKFSPKKILTLSYLMSAPIILASSSYLFLKSPDLLLVGWPALITSFLVGFLTLKILLRFAKKINFSKFTFIFGCFCIIGAILNIIL
ncbi:MAG TPA: undecaprenyl-diphosphate phosphatase [Patescibacteria group bacterium]|nr:undecaprenyl-diphosphate phosphatase [Patescibacteria group bacterium]